MKFEINNQNGSTLFIALIMLLVITVLALSGAREVMLESRITGNHAEQQKLTNEAEAALREGEAQLVRYYKPIEPACSADAEYCFRDEEAAYEQTFTSGSTLEYSTDKDDTSKTTQWYAVPAPAGESDGQTKNPEYGNMMMGIGTFQYEVNVQTETADGRPTNLRSTTAKVFN